MNNGHDIMSNGYNRTTGNATQNGDSNTMLYNGTTITTSNIDEYKASLANTLANVVDDRLARTFALDETQRNIASVVAPQVREGLRGDLRVEVSTLLLDMLTAMAQVPARALGLSVSLQPVSLQPTSSSTVTPAKPEATASAPKRRGRPPKALASPSRLQADESAEDVENSGADKGIEVESAENGEAEGGDFDRLLRAGIPSRRERKARVSRDPIVQERTDYQRGYRSQQRMTAIVDLFKDAPFIGATFASLSADKRETYEALYKEARRKHHHALSVKLDTKGYFEVEDAIRDLLIEARRVVYGEGSAALGDVPPAPWSMKKAQQETSSEPEGVDEFEGDEEREAYSADEAYGADEDNEGNEDNEEREVKTSAKNGLRVIPRPKREERVENISVSVEPIEPIELSPSAQPTTRTNTAALLDIDPDLI